MKCFECGKVAVGIVKVDGNIEYHAYCKKHYEWTPDPKD